MSQVSSDFDEPLLDDADLVEDGFGDSDFGDGGFDSGLEAQDWDDANAEGAIAKAAPIKKQGFSIFTVMLIMSFIFLTAAAIMIFMELGRLK